MNKYSIIWYTIEFRNVPQSDNEIKLILTENNSIPIVTRYQSPVLGGEGALEMAKISCCEDMFLGRIKSELLIKFI